MCDGVAICIYWETCTCTALADTDLDLVRRGAVVFCILQEVRSPQRNHTGRHDVRAQSVQAYHRWCFAILHCESVFVLSIVSATVRDEPLDLVCTVWQLWHNIVVLLLLGVPAYAGRFVVAQYGFLKGKAVLLIGGYRTLVKLTWGATQEVWCVGIAVQYIVPAQSSQACVNRINYCFHHTILIQIKEQQVFDVHI